MFILEVVKALKRHNVKYAIIGGYALAFHGIVRATMDVDLVISLTQAQLKNVEQALQSLRLTSRLPLNAIEVFRFRKEYIKKRNLIAWSFVDFSDPTRAVDILLITSLTAFNTKTFTIKNYKIEVVSLKDLLKMKQRSKRTKDQLDIQLIKKVLNENKNKP